MLQKYNYKRLSDIEPLLGFSQAESAILRENGINSQEEFEAKLPDIAHPNNYKIREFLWDHCYLKGVEKFKEILEKFRDKKICILGD